MIAQILAAEPIKRLITFTATDLLFAAASYVLMLEGQRFGRDRNPGVKLVRYPGFNRLPAQYKLLVRLQIPDAWPMSQAHTDLRHCCMSQDVI